MPSNVVLAPVIRMCILALPTPHLVADAALETAGADAPIAKQLLATTATHLPLLAVVIHAACAYLAIAQHAAAPAAVGASILVTQRALPDVLRLDEPRTRIAYVILFADGFQQLHARCFTLGMRAPRDHTFVGIAHEFQGSLA